MLLPDNKDSPLRVTYSIQTLASFNSDQNWANMWACSNLDISHVLNKTYWVCSKLDIPQVQK